MRAFQQEIIVVADCAFDALALHSGMVEADRLSELNVTRALQVNHVQVLTAARLEHATMVPAVYLTSRGLD